jgi:hypothetical protein
MGWLVGLRKKREDDAYICGCGRLEASSFPHFLVDPYALSIHTYSMGFETKIWASLRTVE